MIGYEWDEQEYRRFQDEAPGRAAVAARATALEQAAREIEGMRRGVAAHHIPVLEEAAARIRALAVRRHLSQPDTQRGTEGR
jgi:hypothetical protein